MRAALTVLVVGSALSWAAWATTELMDRPTKKDFGTYMELMVQRLNRIEDKIDRLVEREQ